MLLPLFSVEEMRGEIALRPLLQDQPQHGYVWPVAVLFTYFEHQPVAAVEMAFHPDGDTPEQPLAEESWTHYRNELGLTPVEGAYSLISAPDGQWHVDFGPHTLVSDSSGSTRLVLPRPSAAWEEEVRANGSCTVVLGTGLRHDDETSEVTIPPTAAALSAAYAGSRSVPELSEILGLHVIPLNSFRPYDPLQPAAFVLDTDVLIEMQQFCFEPSRLRSEERVEAIRHLLIHLSGWGVRPGPALAQLYQPSRTRIDARAALQAFAAFDHLMSLNRAEIMDKERAPATFDPAYERDVASMVATPQMLMMYAAVLRLRQLWRPSHKLAERARSFEEFMQWLRVDLRINAALLVQVAFNLWISDEDAQRQASRLLHFRQAAVTNATLSELWGTAYDLFLLQIHPEVARMEDTADVIILTFDRGLAGMRDFFEHIELADAPIVEGGDHTYTRVKFNFHPRLEYMRPRVAKWTEDLHRDMFERRWQRDSRVYPGSDDLLALVEEEERRVLGATQ